MTIRTYNFKRRFVSPILAGLGLYEPILGLQPAVVRPKRQTIRLVGKRPHARPGDIVRCYFGMRTKQCLKIGDGRCISFEKIVIAFGKRPNDTIISIDGAARYTGPALNDFAASDGFSDWDDMARFWEDEHGTEQPFRGVLIQWEPMQ